MTQEDLERSVKQQEINLKDCDLSGLDLSDRNFERAHFENCDLSGVNFSGTTIKQGEFKNGLLIGGNFEKADLSGVDFTGCAMQKINLSQVRIEGVGIKESNLANASFKSMNIEFSDSNVFKNVNLSGADLSESTITWFQGENVNFRNANFANASILESRVKDCNFANVSFENAELYSVAFKDCKMQQAVLAKAKITNVTFETSTLENVDFKQAEIGYGNFVDSNLDGVDFREVTLSGMNEFRNVSLVAADFSEAKFSEESKLYDVDVTDIKGLDASHYQKNLNRQGDVVADLQQSAAELAAAEYQNQLTLFVAKAVGSEVNAEVDCKIAQVMLEQGHADRVVESAIALHSPNAGRVSKQVEIYAMNIVKKAKKEGGI